MCRLTYVVEDFFISLLDNTTTCKICTLHCTVKFTLFFSQWLLTYYVVTFAAYLVEQAETHV